MTHIGEPLESTAVGGGGGKGRSDALISLCFQRNIHRSSSSPSRADVFKQLDASCDDENYRITA